MLLKVSEEFPIQFIVISSLYISDNDFNIIALSYLDPLKKYNGIFNL